MQQLNFSHIDIETSKILKEQRQQQLRIHCKDVQHTVSNLWFLTHLNYYKNAFLLVWLQSMVQVHAIYLLLDIQRIAFIFHK